MASYQGLLTESPDAILVTTFRTSCEFIQIAIRPARSKGGISQGALMADVKPAIAYLYIDSMGLTLLIR